MANPPRKTPLPSDPGASWQVLCRRDQLMRRLRSFFHRRGFVEVETPVLWHEVIVEAHVDPIPVLRPEDPTGPPPAFLLPSPELPMKSLLARCVPPGSHIFQVTRAFRDGERGRYHQEEFTMVEWYQWGASMEDGMALLGELACQLLQQPHWRSISFQDAFHQHTGLDPHNAPLDALVRAASPFNPSADLVRTGDRPEWIDLLWGLQVEPHLGDEAPVIVFDFPAHQAALAQLAPGPPPVAKRFELYCRGVELANGYLEERDAGELRRRMEAANQQRRRRGARELPIPEQFLQAIASGLPPCCGVALGWDRLVMVALGAQSLEEVRPVRPGV